MTTGIIASFNSKAGSGLIRPDDGSADVAFHVSEVERAGWANVLLGERIAYENKYDRARDRRFAVNLELIPPARGS